MSRIHPQLIVDIFQSGLKLDISLAQLSMNKKEEDKIVILTLKHHIELLPLGVPHSE